MSDTLTLCGEAIVTITPAAIKQIKFLMAKKGNPNLALRIGVKGGGCSGLSYQFKFDAKARPNDHVYDFDGIQVLVDPKSMIYLDGMTLDWKDSLIHSGFEFDNPHAKKSCGCGTSFTA